MKIISIASVAAGGATTAVNEIKKRLQDSVSLHFEDYTFSKKGENYNDWDLTQLKEDIEKIRTENNCDYLLLDYPFAFLNDMISDYIDCAVFIDTPLDIALARRVIRDLGKISADEMQSYLKNGRAVSVRINADILPNSDFVIDGTKEADQIAEEIRCIIENC